METIVFPKRLDKSPTPSSDTLEDVVDTRQHHLQNNSFGPLEYRFYRDENKVINLAETLMSRT
jgi:hypothetical protein